MTESTVKNTYCTNRTTTKKQCMKAKEGKPFWGWKVKKFDF